MTNRTPLCPFEHVEDADLEARQIDETVLLTVKLLQARYPTLKPVLRGVHPKSHGCVQATFTVNADLAPALRVGLFAQPGKQFAAVVRFSKCSGPGRAGRGLQRKDEDTRDARQAWQSRHGREGTGRG